MCSVAEYLRSLSRPPEWIHLQPTCAQCLEILHKTGVAENAQQVQAQGTGNGARPVQ
jgi:hypothetical protein